MKSTIEEIMQEKGHLPGPYHIKKDWKPCCDDFKITIEYNHLKKSGSFWRFAGHVIYYCPFCGKNLEGK